MVSVNWVPTSLLPSCYMLLPVWCLVLFKLYCLRNYGESEEDQTFPTWLYIATDELRIAESCNKCVNSLWCNMCKLKIKLLLISQCSLPYNRPHKCTSKTSLRMYPCQIMKDIMTPLLQSRQILFATNDTNQNGQSADLATCTNNFCPWKTPTQGRCFRY